MKLMTKAIEKKIPALYEQEELGMDAIVYVKYFNPTGAQTWYITEYDPVTKIMFGYCDLGHGGELGYVSLTELEGIKIGLVLGIERGMNFKNQTIKEAIS